MCSSLLIYLNVQQVWFFFYQLAGVGKGKAPCLIFAFKVEKEAGGYCGSNSGSEPASGLESDPQHTFAPPLPPPRLWSFWFPFPLDYCQAQLSSDSVWGLSQTCGTWKLLPHTQPIINADNGRDWDEFWGEEAETWGSVGRGRGSGETTLQYVDPIPGKL